MAGKLEWLDSWNGWTVGIVGQLEWLEHWSGWKVGKSERSESQKVRMVEQLESGNGWYGWIVE